MPKYYKREMPDLRGTGERKYYYEMRSEGAIDTAELVKRMRQRYRILDEGALKGVVYAMVNTMTEALVEGHSISIDGMGNFSLAVGLDDYNSNTAEQRRGGEPNARRVSVRDVRFKAHRIWVRDINYQCSLHRDTGGTRNLCRPATTREERISKALDFIRENGFMRAKDYVQLTGLSKTTAGRELKEITDDKSMPIVAKGKLTHKVYVERKQYDEGEIAI